MVASAPVMQESQCLLQLILQTAVKDVDALLATSKLLVHRLLGFAGMHAHGEFSLVSVTSETYTWLSCLSVQRKAPLDAVLFSQFLQYVVPSTLIQTEVFVVSIVAAVNNREMLQRSLPAVTQWAPALSSNGWCHLQQAAQQITGLSSNSSSVTSTQASVSAFGCQQVRMLHTVDMRKVPRRIRTPYFNPEDGPEGMP